MFALQDPNQSHTQDPALLGHEQDRSCRLRYHPKGQIFELHLEAKLQITHSYLSLVSHVNLQHY